MQCECLIGICIQREKIWETLLVRSVSQTLPKNFQYSPKSIVFLWQNYGLGRVLKVFWRDGEPFYKKGSRILLL